MINDIPTFRVDHMPYGGVKESGTYLLAQSLHQIL
jgi:acyl-CoA reductase-like NAD-dependent aldehyde dehydrogenase